MDSVPSILCVDDEPEILHALRRDFRKRPYRLTTAGSGDEPRRTKGQCAPLPAWDGTPTWRNLAIREISRPSWKR